MLRVEVVMLVLMLVAAARAHGELLPHRAFAWPLLLGALVALAGSACLCVAYEGHPRCVTRAL